MPPPQHILVLGAGELGTAILSSLSTLSPPSTSITVLLRPSTLTSTDPAKIASLTYLKSLPVHFLAGDISSSTIPELATLFSPFDLVICCLGFSSGLGSQVKITQAVLEAKVKRYIPWQFGVDYDIVGRGSAQPVWDEQLDVRDLLRGQEGTQWVVVSTGIFMSFLFEPAFGVVDMDADDGMGVVRALGSWENTVTVTTPSDIGKLTSMIALEEGSWGEEREEIVFVAGETVSYGRVKGIVEKVFGRRIRGEVCCVDFLKEVLERDIEDVMKKYRVVFAEGRGVSWGMERTWNVKRGVEVMGVEAFAREKLGGKLSGK